MINTTSVASKPTNQLRSPVNFLLFRRCCPAMIIRSPSNRVPCRCHRSMARHRRHSIVLIWVSTVNWKMIIVKLVSKGRGLTNQIAPRLDRPRLAAEPTWDTRDRRVPISWKLIEQWRKSSEIRDQSTIFFYRLTGKQVSGSLRVDTEEMFIPLVCLAASSRPLTVIDVPVTMRKMEKHSTKKTLANRLSKPFSSLKFSVPKALQSQTSSHESSSAISNQPSSIPAPYSSSTKSSVSKKSVDSSHSASSSKKLQTDLDYLRDQLSQKEMLIVQLTRISQEERVKFERDTQQLHRMVEQLQEENLRLKEQLRLQ